MSKNVLVIERDFETSRQIAKALEGEGYFVFTASSAEAGLVMARRVKPSLLFLNLLMRDAGGVEFLKKLRSLDFLHNVPILLLTQKQEEYDARYAGMYGIVNFVSVPVNETEVVAKSKASLEHIPAHGPEVKKNPPAKDNPVFPEMPGKGLSQDADENIDVGGPHKDAQAEGPEDVTLQASEKNNKLQQNENFIVRIDNGASGGPDEAHFAGGVMDEGRSHEDRGLGEKEENAPAAQGVQKEAGDSLKEGPGLFGEKEEKAEPEMPGQGEAAKTGAAGAGHLMPEWKGGIEDIMPAEFDGQKKKKSLVSKGFLWMIGVVLLGAASSFFFFMYISPKPVGQTGQTAPSKAGSQPVIVEQNTPAVAVAAASASANPKILAQQEKQKPQKIDGKKAAQQALGQPAAPGEGQVAAAANGQHKAETQKPLAQGHALVQKKARRGGKTGGKAIAASAASSYAKQAKVKKAARAAKMRKRRKSAGYWALLNREEAQLKAQAAGPGKAKLETRKPAQRAGKKAAHAKRQLPAHHIYSLQVGAFASLANARKLTSRLDSEGFKAGILQSKVAGKTMYKVLVGRFDTAAAGDAAARKLSRKGLKAFRHYE